MMKKLFEKINMQPRQLVLCGVFSALFALACVLGRCIYYYGGIKGTPGDNFMRMPNGGDIPIFLGCALICFILIVILYRLCDKFALSPAEGGNEKRFAMIAFVLLQLSVLPYLLSFYPGLISGDALSSMEKLLEVGRPTSNHHPILYSYILLFFLRIGELSFGHNFGLFLYSLTQSVIVNICVVYMLVRLRRMGVHKLILALCLAYFILIPLFAANAVSFWKDPLYSCALLLLSIELYDCAKLKELGRKEYTRLILLSFWTAFIRNNGIYVLVVTALVLFIMYRRNRAKTAAIFGAFIVFYSVLTSAGYKAFDIKQEFVESVGIPLQQIGAVIYGSDTADDFNMTEEEQEYFYTLMGQYIWMETYSPCLVDTIKWNAAFDEEFLEQTKVEFIKHWIHVVLEHPAVVVRAYFMETHGFWKLFAQDDYGYADFLTKEVNEYGAADIRMSDKLQEWFGISLAPALSHKGFMLGRGTLFWLTALAFLVIILRKSPAWLACVPALANWLFVMASTPAAYGMRYVYIFALGLPFFLCLAFVKNEH